MSGLSGAAGVRQRVPKSYLFVPGNRPDRFTKAVDSGAHVLILDLEDAVGPDDKDAARRSVFLWLADGGDAIVRINGADTPWHADDLAAVANWGRAAVMVPKADAGLMARMAEALPGRPLVGLVETVAGLIDLLDVAQTRGVARLAFGNIDFGADARLPEDSPALNHVRFDISIASRHADLPPPIDGVTTALDDAAILDADVARAKAFGFVAKLCIHPRQVAAVNAGFAPTALEIQWSHDVVDAISASGGAVAQVGGKMVDRPMLARAEAILADEGDA